MALPNFSTKEKTANQPTTAAVPENPVTKKGRDWLLSDFLFGTEIGEGQLKKPPTYNGSKLIEEKIEDFDSLGAEI